MKKAIAILIMLIAIGCTQKEEIQNKPKLKELNGTMPSGTATTMDGETIAYQIYPAMSESPAVILLHMLGRSRTDWDSTAKWLQKNGYSVITPDIRGHGQSTGELNKFTSEDFNKMVNDVAAMKAALQNEGADVKRLAIIGASIGANIAYNYAVKDTDVATVILLSPGLDYRGIKVDVNLLNKPFLVVASNEDTYSATTAEGFRKNSKAEVVMYETAGHGTNMFTKKELAPTILQWLKEHT